MSATIQAAVREIWRWEIDGEGELGEVLDLANTEDRGNGSVMVPVRGMRWRLWLPPGYDAPFVGGRRHSYPAGGPRVIAAVRAAAGLA